MNKKEPFLTEFSSLLIGSAQCSTQALFQENVQEKVQEFGCITMSELSMVFEDILPSAKLNEWHQSERERIYHSTTTLWAWCSQLLVSNASYHKAVSQVQAWREQLGLPVTSPQTKAYCEARKRLPESFP
ncbi:MAG: hypothetical protein ACI9SQ_002137 [Rubritalea sp.]